MKTLTAKEEKFAQLVALEGFTQHDAYLEAYDVTTTNGNTIDSKASKIASKVGTRIVALHQKTVTPKIATLVRRKEHATEVMEDGGSSKRDQLSANKLIGEYEKDFVTQIDQRTLVVDASLSTMTREELGEYLTEIRALKAFVEGMPEDEREGLLTAMRARQALEG